MSRAVDLPRRGGGADLHCILPGLVLAEAEINAKVVTSTLMNILRCLSL